MVKAIPQNWATMGSSNWFRQTFAFAGGLSAFGGSATPCKRFVLANTGIHRDGLSLIAGRMSRSDRSSPELPLTTNRHQNQSNSKTYGMRSELPICWFYQTQSQTSMLFQNTRLQIAKLFTGIAMYKADTKLLERPAQNNISMSVTKLSTALLTTGYATLQKTVRKTLGCWHYECVVFQGQLSCQLGWIHYTTPFPGKVATLLFKYASKYCTNTLSNNLAF